MLYSRLRPVSPHLISSSALLLIIGRALASLQSLFHSSLAFPSLVSLVIGLGTFRPRLTPGLLPRIGPFAHHRAGTRYISHRTRSHLPSRTAVCLSQVPAAALGVHPPCRFPKAVAPPCLFLYPCNHCNCGRTLLAFKPPTPCSCSFPTVGSRMQYPQRAPFTLSQTNLSTPLGTQRSSPCRPLVSSRCSKVLGTGNGPRVFPVLFIQSSSHEISAVSTSSRLVWS